MSETKALALKQEGNSCFKQGDYVGAEGFYSKAIIASPKNEVLYTNRAMARLKLELWDAVVNDCHDALAIKPENMKANFYLSQALLPMGDHDGAVQAALRAHKLCVDVADHRSSLPAVTALVLRCKKERWDHKEKMRRREARYLENETVDLLEREKAAGVAAAETEGERAMVSNEWDAKIEEVRRVFEKSREKDDQRREVPDWVVDDISFGIMVDPVITKMGKSYERASIMEHLQRHPSDPLTRDPLHPSDLRPNLALRQACEEFLEENGWAVDW